MRRAFIRSALIGEPESRARAKNARGGGVGGLAPYMWGCQTEGMGTLASLVICGGTAMSTWTTQQLLIQWRSFVAVWRSP